MFISCDHFKLFMAVNSCECSTWLYVHTNLSAVWFGREGTITHPKREELKALWASPVSDSHPAGHDCASTELQTVTGSTGDDLR